MGNLNYTRSRQRETLVRHQMEKAGWLAARTAGSHGLADVIAIRPSPCGHGDHYEVRFIQIKVSERIMAEKVDFKIETAPFGDLNVEYQFYPVKSEKYYVRKNKLKKKSLGK